MKSRNYNDYQTIECKSQLYYNSFLPSTVREWNLFNASSTSIQSLSSFKKKSIKHTNVVPSYFGYGYRKYQVLHTRLRTNCSSLNYDLYRKNIVHDEHCVCGEREDATHFLFYCPRFNAARQYMLDKLLRIYRPTVEIPLWGHQSYGAREYRHFQNCTCVYKTYKAFHII